MSLNNVNLSYQTRSGFFKTFVHKALNNVNFDISRGDIFGVLGRNGSGKSSLLKILAGIIQPDSGTITIQPGVTRALLTLGLGFNPELTGRDNALISCMLNGLSKKQAVSLLAGIREFTELGDFFEQPVKTYSSGMRSRLGFATGVLLEVDILLIDEVLSVGDNQFKEKAESFLLDKIKGNQTVIFVSHSDVQIEKLCNKCVWLHRGNVVCSGDTTKVMHQYRKSSKELNHAT